MQAIPDVWKWIIGSGVLVVASFVFGGGYPWKAYRRIGDLDLVERMKGTFLLRSEHDAYAREQALVSSRQDEILAMLVEQNKAMLAIAGAVERHTESIKYLSEDVMEVRRDVEGLRRA